MKFSHDAIIPLVRIRFALLLFLVTTFLQQNAWSQQAPVTNEAIAETLFQDARKLMDLGRYSEACSKFEQSYQLDPAGGTLMNWAVCLENQGRFASAWLRFQDSLALAKKENHVERISFAEEHIKQLEPHVSRLRIQLDSIPEKLVIRFDGTPLPENSWAETIPVDPGNHTVVAEAPSFESYSVSVTIPEHSQAVTVEVPLFKKKENIPVPSSVPLVTPSNHVKKSNPWRTVGFTAGGVGLAAIGVGGVFGVKSLFDGQTADELCSSSTCSTPKGMQANDAAHSEAVVSNICIGAGVALLATGIYLVLRHPSKQNTATLQGISLSF